MIMGSSISLIGASEHENIREIQLYSLGEGFPIEFIHRRDPKFGNNIYFTNSVSDGGYYVIIIELDNGDFYRKTVGAGTTINVNDILLPECIVHQAYWHCLYGHEMTVALNNCQYCLRSSDRLALIPIAGVPFGAASAVLNCENE